MEKERLLRIVIEKMPIDYVSLTISIASVFIACISVFVAYQMFQDQKKHNQNSVRPIVDILIGDYEDHIYVKLTNHGVGPAVIDSLKCEYTGKIQIKQRVSNTLVALLAEDGTPTSQIKEYSDFVEDICGRAVPVNGEIILVELVGGNMQDNVALRLMLKDICISGTYHDIYEKSFPYNRKLDFFGRILDVEELGEN